MGGRTAASNAAVTMALNAASAHLAVCETEHTALQNQRATVVAKLDAMHVAANDVTSFLASEAVASMTKTDLDEVRAIRTSPPQAVQTVCTCVVSLLDLPQPQSSDSGSEPPSPTITSVPLPPLSPRGRALPAPLKGTPERRVGAGRSALVSWEVAQRRLGQKDFKHSLVAFDVRRLLSHEASEVCEAVKQRIAVGEEHSPTPPDAPKAARRLSKASWRAAATSATTAAAGDDELPTSSRLGSLATVAAQARRASRESGMPSLGPLGPLTLQDASYGSAVTAALFLWCSRVLANADKIRESEAEATRARGLAGDERARVDAALAVAAARVRQAQTELAMAEAAAQAAAEAEAKAAAEVAEAARAREALEERARAEAREADRQRNQAAEEDRDRRAQRRREHEAEVARQEAEAARMRSSGTKAVLEEVDVVIKQRVEFKAGSAVIEDINVPALICVADLMSTEQRIKVGVQAQAGIELASERAEAICQWLVDQGGVSISRLRVTGSAADDASSAAASAPSGTWHVRFHVIAEVKISDRLEFDGGSDGLRDDSKDTLRAVARIMKTRRDLPRLTIEGHTCTDGPEEWNMVLSNERARSVERFLLDECGVPPARLQTVGHGPKKPLVDGYAQRKRNRRVEFLVL